MVEGIWGVGEKMGGGCSGEAVKKYQKGILRRGYDTPGMVCEWGDFGCLRVDKYKIMW